MESENVRYRTELLQLTPSIVEIHWNSLFTPTTDIWVGYSMRYVDWDSLQVWFAWNAISTLLMVVMMMMMTLHYSLRNCAKYYVPYTFVASGITTRCAVVVPYSTNYTTIVRFSPLFPYPSPPISVSFSSPLSGFTPRDVHLMRFSLFIFGRLGWNDML